MVAKMCCEANEMRYKLVREIYFAICDATATVDVI